ncbi:hypothetical protein EUA06_20180 [Nocardioides glacieisoli]|uniref:Uncharacterized protein n=1 Tax=Nocardioides glacieisoli TaxID=1168730 RepID=A0A4Q2RJT5_9ACTN|nr:DUF6049 family protein [Nocardioides glacieisoli]RYB88608.1 hypothetical protein EUA06_20180 [Nocardioides glacieisoli]
MPRSSSFRAVLAGFLTAGLASLGAQAPAAAAPAEEQDPLVVHIDTIDPVLPRSGDVVITGTVTNVSADTYTRINLHAFSSENPILDSANLVTSAASDPTQAVGDRVTVPGTFYTVAELAPGQTAYFSDTVPVELLEMDPRVEGVYWIGIHAFGDGAVPRDGFADGRARTFIPARPSADGSAETSVILSLRSPVWFTDDGKVAGLDRWEKRLGEGGSLDGVLDMADSADATPYSWLVDPAVLVALTRLERGNPARSIVPDPNIPIEEPASEEPASETPASETPAPEEATEPTEAPGGWDTLAPPTSPDAEPTAQEQALATAAAGWLNRFRDLVGTQPVLTLPFGDLDVSAAVRNDRTRLDQAVARSAEVMRVLRLPSRPAVSPAGDRLSPEGLQTVSPETVILMGDSAFDFPPTTPNSVVKMLGHKVLVTSTAAESGGPGPTAATDPLAMRQRLLSEAALRALDDDSAPLILTLPTVWRGEDAAAFFDELEQPWLDIVPVEEIADDRNAVGQPASTLNYTTEDQAAEIGAGNFTAATRATNAANLLEQVLLRQTTIEGQVRDEALVTVSEQHRTRPGVALKSAGRLEAGMSDYLGKIQIEAPPAVTLFSASGKLGATLVNLLDQPVTVEVRPTTDGQLTISGLGGARTLGPDARSVLRYEATTDQLGTHNVRFFVTSVEGAPLGSSDALPIRAARVSALVWVAMAGGALVLFGMIGYRLPGQIRARRAELAAASRGEDHDEASEDEAREAGDGHGESASDVRPAGGRATAPGPPVSTA